MRDLPETHKTFRGNLTMPLDATPDDHRRVKETFLQSLRRWKNRTGIVLEIHAFLHATDPHNAHWDFVGYHAGRPQAAHAAIRDLWVRSGGLRATAVGMSADEHGAVNSYQSHPQRPIVKRTLTVSRTPIYVFRPRAEMGLEIVWYTSGFWRGSSLEATWSLLIREWFGGDEELTALEQLEQAQREADRAARGAVAFKPVEAPAPPPYVPGDDLASDRAHFLRRLPRSPGEAIGVDVYSRQWGVSATYMLSVLRSCPEAKCLDGWVDPQTGFHVFNAWHRE